MSQQGRFSKRMTGGKPAGLPLLATNGKLPLKALRRLETQPQMPASEQYLAAEPAKGLDAMCRAAKRDGVAILLLEAYRTYERQVYFRNYYANLGKPGMAAKPGTSSHGWGTAIDVDRKHDPDALPWMKQHAIRFGWDWPLWAGDGVGAEEPWHWQAIQGWRYDPEITVLVSGKPIPDAEAFLRDGRVYVALRPVIDAVKGMIVGLPKGGAEVIVPHYLDPRLVSLAIEDGIGYTPVRDFNSLGMSVTFDAVKREVRVQ